MSHEQNYSTSSFKVTVDHIRTYAIFTMDLKGDITSWNEGACQIYGWEESEIVGKPMQTLYSKDNVRLGLPTNTLGLLHSKSVFDANVQQRKKDGSEFL